VLDFSELPAEGWRAAQATTSDCVAAELDVARVMQAGGWTTPRMVVRYTEKLTARRRCRSLLRPPVSGSERLMVAT
jgi:hypothetical protein